jgi:hypothetical protein
LIMGMTPRAKCEDGICVQASPNMECEYGDGWCTTHVMGYGDDQYQLYKATPGMRVSLVSERLESLGVEVGDVIIAIDGKNLHSLDRAAKLSEKVGSGTKLTVIKSDGGRLLIEVD